MSDTMNRSYREADKKLAQLDTTTRRSSFSLKMSYSVNEAMLKELKNQQTDIERMFLSAMVSKMNHKNNSNDLSSISAGLTLLHRQVNPHGSDL